MAYDKNIDYQKKINEALAAGNKSLASSLEVSRNEKIAGMNASGTNTNSYAPTYNLSGQNGPSKDYAAELNKLLGSNPTNYDDSIVALVQQNYDGRNAKIAADPSLSKYANDDVMAAARKYLDSANNYKTTQDALKNIQSISGMNYQSPYAQDIQSLMSGLMNLGEFNYNFNDDPSYKAYEKKFGILGDRAMADTLGEVATMTGGLPSSYAVSAASQAKNQWNEKLTDVIPGLMDAAYRRYQAGIDNDMRMTGILGDLDANMYSRFADSKNSSMDAAQWMADYGYNASRDQVADQQYKGETDYRASRDKILDEQWMKQFSADEQQRMIQNAIDNRQVSVSEGNLALSRVKYKDSKDEEAANDTTYYGEMYQEMLSSGDPEGWIAENAGVLTKEELEWLRKNMPNGSGTGGGLFE